jgi:hypothetical protein
LTKNGESGKPAQNQACRDKAHALIDKLFDEAQSEEFTGNLAVRFSAKRGRLDHVWTDRSQLHPVE